MKRIKKIFALFIFVIFISCQMTVFAVSEIEEEFDFNELDNFLQTVTSDVNKVPDINSRHAVVYDRCSGLVLYGKKENERCKMASTTKIMTAIVVIENVENLNKQVIVSGKAAGTGGSRLGLHKEDKISINDLLYGLLLCSGNDAAVALAEETAGSIEEFAVLMNKKAEELELTNTHFVTPHGLDEIEHYTTAYELARITDYALKNEIFAKIVRTKSYAVNIDGNYKNLNNTNELLGALNGVYGVKTGFTNGANRCLVTSVKRGDMDIISVVLGADTKKDRTKDSIKIIEYTFANYKMLDLSYMLHDKFDTLVEKTEFCIEKGISNNLIMDLDENDVGFYPVNINEIKDVNLRSRT